MPYLDFSEVCKKDIYHSKFMYMGLLITETLILEELLKAEHTHSNEGTG